MGCNELSARSSVSREAPTVPPMIAVSFLDDLVTVSCIIETGRNEAKFSSKGKNIPRKNGVIVKRPSGPSHRFPHPMETRIKTSNLTPSTFPYSMNNPERFDIPFVACFRLRGIAPLVTLGDAEEGMS